MTRICFIPILPKPKLSTYPTIDLLKNIDYFPPFWLSRESVVLEVVHDFPGDEKANGSNEPWEMSFDAALPGPCSISGGRP